MTLMIGPSVAPTPVAATTSGAGPDAAGSDAFSGALNEAHEAHEPQRSDRAAERSRSSEHSQAPEHAHGAGASKPGNGDDPSAPAAAATDPSVVAGGLLVTGGLTPPPAPTTTPADLHADTPAGQGDGMKIAVTAAGHAGAVDARSATPAVAAQERTRVPVDPGASTDAAADQPLDRLHRATAAGPATSAAPSTPLVPNPAAPTVAGTRTAVPTPTTPIVPAAGPTPPAAAATPPAHRAEIPPLPVDPGVASAAAGTGFAAALRDVADPAAPHPGKPVPVEGSPALAAAGAPPAPHLHTAVPVSDVGSIRPAQAPLPEQPLLLGALSRLRDRGNGVHELTVSLHPAELGAVNLTAVVRDGSITVSLAVVDPAARAAVTSALPGLHHDLAQSGFSGVDVSVADHGHAQQDRSGDPRSAGSGGHGPAPRDDRPDERPAPRRTVQLDRYLDRLL
ncbi:MAG TPA: flagellar hook-length control protein FliK [Jatrophihabitans sp.]|jgi:hypothetical protein|nr:flagellar hook-length control protein FliK [Jatrophihabitans sp.]